MKKIILLLIAAIATINGFSQNTFKAFIKDSDSEDPLFGATGVVVGTTNGSTANSIGLLIIEDIPDGLQQIRFSYIGYEELTDTFIFPLATSDTLEILLESESEEMEEVVVSSTRSTRTIQNIPTRVELIAGEELEEKSNMKSGDIRMLLSESTGIQTQQTSATSANASIRIQGLDGRYTQILKDGFPLFSGAASGLGLLQTPPLDLKQVEVIKGSASTLYGGGAIAGLVNLISKTPSDERELRFHFNGSSGKGFDVNGYYGQRFKKAGTTIFASHNRNWAYAPKNVEFSAIPKFERYVFYPKLFVYFNERSKLNVGVNTSIENRIGGDIKYIQGEGDSTHSYFEENKTQRYSTQLTFEHDFDEANGFSFKNSVSYFKRKINIPGYGFDGTQIASFSEATYKNSKEKSEWIAGINFWSDNFQEEQLDTLPLRNYDLYTVGAFVQNLWKATKWLNLETGFRTDYVVDYGFAFLPRVSAQFKITRELTSRVGGGFGYKSPTIFTEESERIQYKNVLPINNNINELEKSYGANVDFNYRTSFADHKVAFSINQLFFYTYLDKPLLLVDTASDLYQFINSNGNMDTKGTETNIKISYKDLTLFIGYTFTDTKLHQNGTTTQNPLTPKHRLNAVLMYEIEEKWRFGLEAYYFSKQELNDGATGKQYVICGFMAEKIWEKISIYVNFENFLDTRQTRFDNIYTGTVTNPTFRDIYAPVDGFLFNGGIKLRI